MTGFFQRLIEEAVREVAKEVGKQIENIADGVRQAEAKAASSRPAEPYPEEIPAALLAVNPPEDITDISKFGDNWEAFLALLCVPEEFDNIRNFIRGADSVRWGREWRRPQGCRAKMAMLIALDDDDQRRRWIKLAMYQRMTSFPGVVEVMQNARTTHEPLQLTVRDLQAIGHCLGWEDDTVLDLFFGSHKDGHLNDRVERYVRDLHRLVEDHFDTISARLTPAKHAHQVVWPRIAAANDGALALLAEQICDAATANSSNVREVALPLIDRLSVDDRVSGLKSVLNRADPKQRVRIVRLVASMPAGVCREDLVAHLNERLDGDRSESVRDALAVLRVDACGSAREPAGGHDFPRRSELERALMLAGRNPRHRPSSFGGIVRSFDPQPRELQIALIQSVMSFGLERSAVVPLIRVDSARLILPYLASGKRVERSRAADLIAALELADATQHLRLAAAEEKDTVVRTAIFGALEALGEPILEYFSREDLVHEAQRAMARTNAMSKAIAWLDLRELPSVRWNDGCEVEAEVVQWFISTSAKSREVRPTAEMRHHFGDMNQGDLHALGAYLIRAWITRDDIQAATNAKGLLAVAACAGGPDVIAAANGYARSRKGGKRLKQKLAMVQVLAWSDDDTAVGHLMALAKSARLKEVRHQAGLEAHEFAKRRNWTIGELVDRSVPHAGFSRSGTQRFDFGDRSYTATLNDDLTIVLTSDETGERVRGLPKGRADEDQEAIAAVKKRFAASKKELAGVAQSEGHRLREAMCAERSWSAADFEQYFLQHPVVARLATRAVWRSETGGGSQLFRPLGDGTLLTETDDEYELPEHARVWLAHTDRHEDAWVAHLADYEVTPLFPQFGRPKVSVGRKDRSIDGFTGVQHSAPSLRSAAASTAWEIGPTFDGQTCTTILREFPTLEVKAILHLGGGFSVWEPHLESNIGFSRLTFVRSSVLNSSFTRDGVKLSRLPATLISEVVADAQMLAQAGGGDLRSDAVVFGV